MAVPLSQPPTTAIRRRFFYWNAVTHLSLLGLLKRLDCDFSHIQAAEGLRLSRGPNDCQSASMDIKAQALCLARLAMVGIIVGMILAIVAAWQSAWLSSAISSGLSIAAALLAVRCYRWTAQRH
jgi:hypothetical protein